MVGTVSPGGSGEKGLVICAYSAAADDGTRDVLSNAAPAGQRGGDG
eukprot:CAMPEP_0197588492 /NCGR_PEP_ID=MMETSP1326-20131121/9758_1 /TAXON_ID=1155430 /ORGANISM="Genus nov. species nov., Strain RCC2288" /LENGTH=45 /DNA_ID= /DNA_START= /DNA_END= /DNA_ORIENTATION=